MGRLNSFLSVSATWVSDRESSPSSRKLKEASLISMPTANRTFCIFPSTMPSLEGTSGAVSFTFWLVVLGATDGKEGLVVTLAPGKAGASTQYLLLLKAQLGNINFFLF